MSTSTPNVKFLCDLGEIPTDLPTFEACREWLQQRGNELGFAVVIGRSFNPVPKKLVPPPKEGEPAAPLVYRRKDLVCDRAGTFKARGAGLRVNTTQKCDCPFKVKVSRRQPDPFAPPGTFTWEMTPKSLVHNHPLSTHRAAHRSNRRDDIALPAIQKLITRMSQDPQVHAAAILIAIFKEYPGAAITLQDIYNFRARMRRVAAIRSQQNAEEAANREKVMRRLLGVDQESDRNKNGGVGGGESILRDRLRMKEKRRNKRYASEPPVEFPDLGS